MIIIYNNYRICVMITGGLWKFLNPCPLQVQQSHSPIRPERSSWAMG